MLQIAEREGGSVLLRQQRLYTKDDDIQGVVKKSISMIFRWKCAMIKELQEVQGWPQLVINGVITPLNGLING